MSINIKAISRHHRDEVIGIYNYYVENSFAAYLETRVPPDFFVRRGQAWDYGN